MMNSIMILKGDLQTMKKKLLTISLCFGLLLVTGCGKVPKLENGQEVIVELKNKQFTADDYYEELKKQTGYSLLINMVDNYIADLEIETDDTAREYADSQLQQTKLQYEQYGADFESDLKAAGFESENEYLEYLIQSYKKEKVLKNYIGSTLTDDEINEYYNSEIFGEITARHILITPDVTDEMTDEEITAAEEAAKAKAQDLITQLNNGADFETLAKENSDDTGSASDGGLIEGFTKSDVVSEFWNASYALEDGQYTSEPVKSTYGYHVILKVSSNEKPALEDVKDDIIDTLVANKLNSDSSLSTTAWAEIRKKYDMNIIDSNIKSLYENSLE